MQRRFCTMTLAMLALILASTPMTPAAAQDFNFVRPIPEIEQRLRNHHFQIVANRGSRALADRTQRVVLTFEDSVVLLAKWANALPGASTFNNEPRFELAAYEIQKLFLVPDEYVVPPTVMRSLPLPYVMTQTPSVQRTFTEAASVLVVLQYWLMDVSPDNYWDQRRAQQDTVYARHIGNFNVLTYLIRHQDSNVGNYLISRSEENPRVFAVDNGIAFGGEPGNRGFGWRSMRVQRLPRATVERLRSISRADLDRALAILAEFEISNGQLMAVTAGENIGPSRGVRRSGNRVQLGLTRSEIGAVESRLRSLVDQLDRGRITVF
jgi:hypothetical protein